MYKILFVDYTGHIIDLPRPKITHLIPLCMSCPLITNRGVLDESQADKDETYPCLPGCQPNLQRGQTVL